MKNRILLTVLSLMVLTACNNQQEMGDTTGQMPVSAGVSGMISQEAASRMANDTWEGGRCNRYIRNKWGCDLYKQAT